MKTWASALLAAAVAVAAPALGQVADSGVDGGADGGGARDPSMQMPDSQDSPESEQTAAEGAPCLDARQCDRGLACKDGRCVPQAPRVIPACGGSPAVVMLGALGMVLAGRRRRR